MRPLIKVEPCQSGPRCQPRSHQPPRRLWSGPGPADRAAPFPTSATRRRQTVRTLRTIARFEALVEDCISRERGQVPSELHYIMSLSRKLYFPKSLSLGAMRWSFLALASFIIRNSRRSFHSLSSCSPCASLHDSPSVQAPLRNLRQQIEPSASQPARRRSERLTLTSGKRGRRRWGSGAASSCGRPRR